MPDLLIRNLEPELKRQIEKRARAHQHNLSEEAKLLIRKGLGAPEADFPMGRWMSGLVRPEDRGDDLATYPDTPAKAPDLG